ncbi:hypothetical protein FOZ62_007868 [Perkinsus olseni]|uniref:Uncharacterized protein n=2 Tax=Perkinsus olseni TaxID=32597 RepID=A0A7J6TQP6_PEROL|nr:hypothetical protein FOZ62_007868 [Perkinsus olseni]
MCPGGNEYLWLNMGRCRICRLGALFGWCVQLYFFESITFPGERELEELERISSAHLLKVEEPIINFCIKMGVPELEHDGGDLRTTCYNCGVSLLKDEGHIRCKGKDYCGTCFAASDTHRQEPYLVIPPLNFVPSRDSQCSQDTLIPAENDPSSAGTPPDASIWTVAVTLALLDAVAKVGVGSWDDVLARMHQAGAGSSKEITPTQCRSWFMLLYQRQPLP